MNLLKTLYTLIFLFIISFVLFKYYPTLDLTISAYFYKDNTFYLKGSIFESFFYYSIRPILIGISIISLGIFFYNYRTKKKLLNITKRKILYIILILALVPGIFVEYGLKKQFERPRPREITLFGGKKDFFPAYTFTYQKSKSFSSGHAAAAFSLVGIAFLANRKKFWISLTLIYGVGMILARIIAGGHFFSDVITSALLVMIANLILYHLFFRDDKT